MIIFEISVTQCS